MLTKVRRFLQYRYNIVFLAILLEPMYPGKLVRCINAYNALVKLKPALFEAWLTHNKRLLEDEGIRHIVLGFIYAACGQAIILGHRDFPAEMVNLVAEHFDVDLTTNADARFLGLAIQAILCRGAIRRDAHDELRRLLDTDEYRTWWDNYEIKRIMFRTAIVDDGVS